MDYAKLTDEIRNAPQSWLPALFLEVIAACVKRGVFKSGEAMLRVCERHIANVRREQ